MTPQEFVNKHGLTMSAKPADSNPLMDGMPNGAAHWSVTLACDSRTFTTPYSMGPAHRRWKRGCTAYVRRFREFDAAKPGGSVGYIPRMSVAAKEVYDAWTEPTPPDLPGVLESLALDWSSAEGATFEEWASALGYDTDSRRAERSYRATLESANRGRAFLGVDAFYELLRDVEW